jgi:DUF1365 family protein
MTSEHALASSIYRGWVAHQRSGPVEHGFRRPLLMSYLDLGEIDDVLALHPLWSRRRWAPIQFRRDDYLGDPDRPLADSVRDLVEVRTGTRPQGAIRMLTHLRTFWWLFNPITLYWCFDADDRPETLVAEVTNTPWHERHAYVLSADDARNGAPVPKMLHVSPFMGMDQTYRFWVSPPGRSLTVRLENHESGQRTFTASLALRRRELDRASMSDALWGHPLQTMRVSAGIYLEAARLRRKGVPVHRRPNAARAADCSSGQRPATVD